MHFHVMTNYYTQWYGNIRVNVWVGNVYRSLYEEVYQILQVLVNYMGMDIVICTGATALIGTCMLYYVP